MHILVGLEYLKVQEGLRLSWILWKILSVYYVQHCMYNIYSDWTIKSTLITIYVEKYKKT